MHDSAPKVLDLATNYSRKDYVSKQVTVVLLSGQRYFIHVNATSITAGELLDNVLRDQDIKEASMFTLALFKDLEYRDPSMSQVSTTVKLYGYLFMLMTC